MKIKHLFNLSVLAVFMTTAAIFVSAQDGIQEKNVRAHMNFLASDAMQGRGSGTQFELLAGQYLASQMQQFGIEPAGDKDSSGKFTFIQTVNMSRNSFAEPPKMSSFSRGKNVSFVHGKEMIVLRLSAEKIKGELQKVSSGDDIKKGSVAFVAGKNAAQKLGDLLGKGAAAVIVEETPRWRGGWERSAKRKISFSTVSGKQSTPSTAIIIVSKEAAKSLAEVTDGTTVEIGGKLGEAQKRQTWNSIGMIKGSDSKLSSEVILLSAHMDHVGVRENAPGEDKIYNGADDDASGCVAVLELARVLARGKRPKRTVYFAFFGSEESGGFGSKYFANNLNFPQDKLIANLQFEMLGRPDAKVAANELWLTGYERSNLGSELAKRGAKLVQDPHPTQNFFQRSDNYTLAKKGIVAHTVSSFGLHKDYHQASDEIKTIDFEHMTRSVNSMIKPVEWLINSDFTPKWHEGKRP